MHHARGLRRELVKSGLEQQDAERIAAALLSDSWELSPDLSSQDRAMLGYSEKLTLAPQAMNELDIHVLRSEGFDDRAIHDICCVASYFAFVNRIADGLGVELEASDR